MPPLPPPRRTRANKSAGQKPSQKAPPVALAPRSRAQKLEIANDTLGRLTLLYPDAEIELDSSNPYELICATILSAQCTDERVNKVTPALFRRYPDPAALADAMPAELEDIIHSTGFYRAKAKNLIGMAQALVANHNGTVPADMDALTALPGVGRKTANVVLGNAFGINTGFVVDTHVQRVTRRLGLTREPDPVAIERELMALFPSDSWTLLSHLLIWHGRRTCFARKPDCQGCVLNDICPSAFLF